MGDIKCSAFVQTQAAHFAVGEPNFETRAQEREMVIVREKHP